ncbi:MAG: hypothetical protein SOT81_03385 [Treponema sp.]|nr:hypothetical protein [Treponema sp.]
MEEIIYKKKLPLDNKEFSKKYWDKNNNVFSPANKALQNGRNVYFLIFKNDSLQSKNKVISITFKRGDIFVELESKQSIKIPMNMKMADSYIDYNHIEFSAMFYGSDNWKVSENSYVSDCKYLLTSFEQDDKNPLLNKNAPTEDIRISKGNSFAMISDNHSTAFGFESDEEHDEKWNKFFAKIKEKSDKEERIIITIYQNQEDEDIDYDEILLQGTLTEINADEKSFYIGIDNKIISIEETTEELDIYTSEDYSSIIGYFPCSIKKDNEVIDVIIFFSSLSENLLIEDTSEEDYEFSEDDNPENTDEVIDEENIESWNSLYENIDIMFKIQEPVFFSIINNDSKEVILSKEISEISFENGLATFYLDEDESFTFDINKTIIFLDCDYKTRIFTALFHSNFIIEENNTKKEFTIFITNEK